MFCHARFVLLRSARLELPSVTLYQTLPPSVMFCLAGIAPPCSTGTGYSGSGSTLTPRHTGFRGTLLLDSSLEPSSSSLAPSLKLLLRCVTCSSSHLAQPSLPCSLKSLGKLLIPWCCDTNGFHLCTKLSDVSCPDICSTYQLLWQGAVAQSSARCAYKPGSSLWHGMALYQFDPASCLCRSSTPRSLATAWYAPLQPRLCTAQAWLAKALSLWFNFYSAANIDHCKRKVPKGALHHYPYCHMHNMKT